MIFNELVEKSSCFCKGSIQFLNGYYLQLQEIEATIKIAEVNGYVMMLKKARMEKESLEKIIAKLEEKGGKRNG